MFASNALSVQRLLEFGEFEGPKCKDPVRSSLVVFSVPLLKFSQVCHKLEMSLLS